MNETILIETDAEILVSINADETVIVDAVDAEIEIALDVVGAAGPRGPQGVPGPIGPAGDGSDIPNLTLIFENHLI